MTSYPLDVARDAHITVHFRTDLDRLNVLQYNVRNTDLEYQHNCIESLLLLTVMLLFISLPCR